MKEVDVCRHSVADSAARAARLYEDFSGPKLTVDFAAISNPRVYVSNLATFVQRPPSATAINFLRPDFVHFGERTGSSHTSHQYIEPSKNRGLVSKVVSFSTALARHTAAGFPTLSSQRVEDRLAVCRGCNQYDETRNACRMCGCNLTLKLTWADQACPLGKWAAE